MESETLDRLESLLRLYREGYRNPVIDQAVAKLVTLEVERARADLTRLEERLATYEAQYAMSSPEFYTKFESGEMGDDADVVEWSILWDMHQATHKRLDELTRAPA